MMPRSNGANSGRIRVTNDSFDPLAPDLEVRLEHVNAVNATKMKESQPQTRIDYRNRLQTLINWWMVQYPEYYEQGTRVLSEEERNDPTKFYHKCTQDLVYEGLRVDMVLAFIGAHKWKEDGTMYSDTHIRKFHDSVLFGSILVNKGLPSAYHMEMSCFIRAYRKEFAGEKKAGNADE